MDKKSRDLVMAKLYFKNKDYKMAEKSFNEYLNVNPEDVTALKLLAQVYEQNKRFDKAFEMYERCYLAEPDRTGVLLDICRILLMNEICLDHVDYRKWLNLAIKAFPSNPIVVNFKAFLSTLPPDDQTNVQVDVKPKSVSKSSLENAVIQILDKLSLIESKLEDVENKISNLAQSQIIDNQKSLPIFTATTKTSSLPTDAKPITPVKAPEPEIKTTPPLAQFPANKLFNTPTVAPVTSPASNILSQPFSLSNTIKPAFGSSFPFEKKDSPFTFSSSLFTSTLATPNPSNDNHGSQNGPPGPTKASPNNTFSLSGNLFSDSIKKMNLPLEGSWTTQANTSFSFSQAKGKENGKNASDEEDDHAHNEELPIENTCDMQPIEYKTGEEDEDILFEQRCKLFRYKDKEYKERGLGNIKVLKHKSTGRGRLIMRREAVGRVCLNCSDCSKIERVRDNQLRFAGCDVSDGEADLTMFLVKLKTPELTDEFQRHMTSLFSGESSNNTSVSSAAVKPDVELIGPKLDQTLVDKARKLQLPDLFYHKLINQVPCEGCIGCKNED